MERKETYIEILRLNIYYVETKLKICGINLTAYSVALVIMLLLSVCSKIIRAGKTCTFLLTVQKQTVTGIDTTKLSVYEHEKAFLFPHFDAIPQMPERFWTFVPITHGVFPLTVHPCIKVNTMSAGLSIGLTKWMFGGVAGRKTS